MGIYSSGDVVAFTLSGYHLTGVIENVTCDLVHAGAGDVAEIRTGEGWHLAVPLCQIEQASPPPGVA